jgi:hypothetical protein
LSVPDAKPEEEFGGRLAEVTCAWRYLAELQGAARGTTFNRLSVPLDKGDGRGGEKLEPTIIAVNRGNSLWTFQTTPAPLARPPLLRGNPLNIEVLWTEIWEGELGFCGRLLLPNQ